MNLCKKIYIISWRKFCVLLGGLSKSSVLVQYLTEKIRKENEIIENPEEAEKAVNRVWG